MKINPRSDEVGGIDFNPANLDIQVQGEGVMDIPAFNVPFDIQNFQGFTFQIIKIEGLDSLDNLMELSSRP
jgi:hypothetical protein